ncbi:NYN domain-containing protein [Botrimarina mediterranea]|uniref:YacP-like NYN domain protein n=1 Tax=Botrimarina mediterranea TaxID=2528022 RepID=A0A518KCB2_9BACT|nr:NYN domain-containing protein [Botrimarina mediterranea]QDV75437.1 YacP-like NYN domain protein [Botrimarina mediterranea]QDV80070.1 YacP-like NYN domain protein [Planctomycetes bacterium K2D]
MRLLIDGYNLLHATDLFGAGELAGTLRGSREALVAFLAQRLSAVERRATVIVFDAAEAPPGLPDRVECDGIDLRFARGFPNADEMIEAILEPMHRAKHLTVVSGDRRVQRAARSSGARWVDSDAWFADLCRRPVIADEASSAKPIGPVGTTADWVAEFSDPEALAEIERQAAAAAPPKRLPPRHAEDAPAPSGPAAEKPKKRRRPPLDPTGDKPAGAFGAGIDDLFPPGYGEDLLDGDDNGDNRADHRPRR